MKTDELRKIISEEVRKAVKQELRELINEAIEIASRPSQIQETRVPVRTTGVNKTTPVTCGITSMLERTAATMTADDYKNITLSEGTSVVDPGLGSTGFGELPSFAKRAGEIFRASENIKRK